MKQLIKTAAYEQLAEQLSANATYALDAKRAYVLATRELDTANRYKAATRQDIGTNGYLEAKRNKIDAYHAFNAAVHAADCKARIKNLAHIKCKSANWAARQTARAIVARLLIDNADILAGANMRYKRTVKMINDTMPDGLDVYYSEYNGEYRFNAEYLDSSDREYGVPLWNEVFDIERERTRLENHAQPGATPEQIEQQLNGLKPAYDAIQQAQSVYRDATGQFRDATSALVINSLCSDLDSVLRELGWCF